MMFAIFFSSMLNAQALVEGSPNNILWQKQSASLIMNAISNGQKLYYNRNSVSFSQSEIFADLPTQVGYLYRLEVQYEGNLTNNTFINLSVDGKKVASSTQANGKLSFEFIAKKTLTRISMGGSNHWLASFIINHLYLGVTGSAVATGTYVGSLFDDLTVDISSPDLMIRCTGKICKVKVGVGSYGPKNILRIFFAELPSTRLGISAGNQVIGIASNFVDSLNSGLYVEVSFTSSTTEAEISLEKDAFGRYNIKINGI